MGHGDSGFGPTAMGYNGCNPSFFLKSLKK
jgi:hypothetical protein